MVLYRSFTVLIVSMYLCIISDHLHSFGLPRIFHVVHTAYKYLIQNSQRETSFIFVLSLLRKHRTKQGAKILFNISAVGDEDDDDVGDDDVDVWVNLSLIYFQLFGFWIRGECRYLYSDDNTRRKTHTIAIEPNKSLNESNEALNDLSIVCGFNANE